MFLMRLFYDKYTNISMNYHFDLVKKHIFLAASEEDLVHFYLKRVEFFSRNSLGVIPVFFLKR